MSAEDRLKELNRLTFDAGSKKDITEGGKTEAWDEFLGRVLADNFRIRRANRSLAPEGRDQMIRTTAGRTPAECELSDIDAVAFEGQGHGMVTCVAAMGGKKYHNVKLFRQTGDREGADWRCVYWSVTELPTA